MTRAVLPSGQVRVGYDPAQDVRIRIRGPGAALWYSTGCILWQDIQAEARNLASVAPMSVLGVLIVLMLSLAVETASAVDPRLVSGVLWGALLLSGPLGLERIFSTPDARETMTFLLSAPVARAAIFLGKWLFGTLLLLCTALMSLLAVTVLFDFPAARPWMVASLVLGCLGYAAAGTVVSAMTAAVRRGPGLAAVVVVPLALPLFMAGTGFGTAVLALEPWPAAAKWLVLIVLFDIIAATGGVLVSGLLWQDWP